MLVVKPFDRQDFVISSFLGLSNKHGQEKQRRHLEKRCDERKKHDKKKQRRYLTMLTEKRWDEKNERENKMKINEVDKKMR